MRTCTSVERMAVCLEKWQNWLAGEDIAALSRSFGYLVLGSETS